MNKLTKIAAAAACAGAVGIGTAIYVGSNSFSADEKATIRLVQEFKSCADTHKGPYTAEQAAKASEQAKKMIDDQLQRIPAELRPPQNVIDQEVSRVADALQAENACIDQTGINIEETVAKLDAMAAKHGPEKLIKALEAKP